MYLSSMRDTADSCEKLGGEISRIEPIMRLTQIGLRKSQRQGSGMLGRRVARWMLGDDWGQVNNAPAMQCTIEL